MYLNKQMQKQKNHGSFPKTMKNLAIKWHIKKTVVKVLIRVGHRKAKRTIQNPIISAGVLRSRRYRTNLG